MEGEKAKRDWAPFPEVLVYLMAVNTLWVVEVHLFGLWTPRVPWHVVVGLIGGGLIGAVMIGVATRKRRWPVREMLASLAIVALLVAVGCMMDRRHPEPVQQPVTHIPVNVA